ncbi:MAG: hypothetical protein DRG30_05460 [Epsilonproteobacteria bacterium]|nr:MAG: hypothetical protein DRG30_05460 [Campylobacterota bacterium]
MKISIINSINRTGTNVVDNTELFDPTIHRNFAPNAKMKFDDHIWQNVGNIIYIPDYDPSNTTYSAGDLVYDNSDNRIKKVVEYGTYKVPKQPEDYTSGVEDVSTPIDDWTKRYVKIFENYPTNNDYTVEGVQHVFYDNIALNGGVDQFLFPTPPPPYYHGVHIKVILEINNSTPEYICELLTSKYFYFHSVILRGSTLYGRTWCDAAVEYNDIQGSAILEPVTHIGQIDGFVKVKTTNDNAPFDGTIYNAANQEGTMSYSFDVSGSFDTVALAGVIGATATVYFKNEAGTIIDTVSDYPINNSRGNINLPPYPTTIVVYSNTVITNGGSITVEVNEVATGEMTRIGEIACGLSVGAGFSNLNFSTSFKDHSPKNVDTWGNVEYINGVKVFTYSASCDVDVSDYDNMARLMASLGQSKVIVNGSDTTNNAAPDGLTVFSATMLLGRISGFTLKTNVKNGRMSPLASYNFLLTEIT